jgi:hypothetical protein
MDKDVNQHGDWEKGWQQALEGAEITPPVRAWKGVEQHLLSVQLKKYKRRAFWFQQLAAAAILLLILVSGYSIYVANPVENYEQASGTTLANSAEAVTPKSAVTTNNATQERVQETLKSDLDALAQSHPDGSYKSIANIQNSSFIFLGNSWEEDTNNTVESLDWLAHLNPDWNSLLDNEKELIVNPVLEKAYINFAYLAQATDKPQPKERKKDKKVWLGFSMAGNFFDPNYATAPNSALTSLNNPVSGKGGQQLTYTANVDSWNSNRQSLPSLNLQLDAMFQLHNRLYLATSVGYGGFRSESKMGVYTGDDGKRYPLHYANFDYSKLETVSVNSRSALPVDAVSKFNFLQIPLKLNYLVVDRKFGVAPVLGLNTQIFLNAKLQPVDNQFIQDYDVTPEDNSPFKRMYFTGIAGLQLFYHTSRGTAITLEPTYQRALMPLNKNNYLFSSEPSNIGISVGIRKRIK